MMDISRRAARLIQPDLPGTERLDEISDLRERIEMFHHPRDYAGFLEVLFPAFEKVLRGLIPPSFRSDDVNHKIRLKVMEVLHRLPVNDTLSKYASQLFKICLEIIRTDNEENAMLAVRIIFELERAIPQSLDRESPEFIDLVQQLYAGMEASIANAFTEASLESGADRTSPPESDGPYTILPGIHSFRVIVECPLIVMLILNIMHNMNARLATLVPQLLKALSARMPSSVLQQNLEAKPGRVRQFRFESMLMCQVKTLSFLTYVLISHTDLVLKHEAEMAYHVQNLLRIIPAECISVRRELLVATRHILSKNTNKGLFPYLNALLDESVLLGTPNGRLDLAVKPMPPVQNLPAPGAPQTQPLNSSAGGVQNRLPSRKQPLVNLAYAALTDLVMAMRGMMDVSQLSRVVYLYTRNIHDASLPLSTQITSARVLLNLVDGIYHQRDSSQQHGSAGVQGVREFGAHGLLIKILDALARKLSTLRYLMKRIAVMERISANQVNTPKTVDEVAIPMESFLLVRPAGPPSGSADTGSSDAPPPAAPLERTLSIASAAVEQGGGEVVKVEVFPGGQNGMRRKRPAMPRGVDLGEHRELDRAFVLGIAAPFESSAYQHDTTAAPPDTMRDVCHLIRTIIWGLRTVLYCITNIDASTNPSVTGASPGSAASKVPGQTPGAPSQNPVTPPTKVLGEEDLKLISKTFAWGIQCLSAYDPRVNPERPPADLDSDENEVIELMSNAFAVLDATTFTDVMQENIRLFYTCMLKHRKIARIATNFLRSSTLSRPFASVLVPFLLSRYSLIGGRAGPMYSSIETYVDALMAGKLGEAEDNDNDKSWVYLSSPPHATSPARLFEATYFGGSMAQSLKQPKPVSSTSASVPETTNFGLVVDEKALLDAVFSDTEEFSADEEAYLLFKLHKATFQSLQQSVRQLTSPPAQQTCLYGLTSLLAAYLEPTAIACLSAAADTMAFPLESLRRPRTDASPPSKIDFEDVADNAISCLRTMLAVAVEGVQDMREAIRSTVQRVAKAIARACNRLLIVAIQDPSNYVAMNRADAIAELCLVISFALLDDANLLALPFSHALSAGIRGNDMLVTKALGALERLIQLNGFDRVCVARGGLVAKALRHLVKHAPTHSSTALKLQGRSAYETPAQYFFPDSPEEHKTYEVNLKVPWKGAHALADLDLTQTAKAVCSYLEDVFTPPKLTSVVGSAKAELNEQDLIEIHQKREAVDLIISILKMATASSGIDHARDRELLTSMFTCVADAFIGDHSWTLLQDQIALRPVPMGEAMTKAFVRGCPHRARAAERLLIAVGASTSGVKFSVLKEGLFPSLLESLKEKTWFNRTGGLWALSIVLKTEAGKALAIDFEKNIVQSVCLALVDHQVELGSDALFHAGNSMHHFLEAMNHMIQPGTIDILLEALFRAENPRARRILRGSIVASIQRRPADNRDEVARSARALIERSQANPLTRTEMSSLSVLAARLEYYLFVLEELDEISAFALKSARELATDLLARLPILLADDPDSLHTDPEAFSFTFMPTTAVFRTSFFRLVRRICEKAAAEQDIEQIDPMALTKTTLGAINSVWPMVSHAAELLIRTLSGIEGYPSTVETLVREQVDKFLDNPGRGVSYTISAIRGLDRMLGQTISKLPSVLPSTFAQGVLTALAERCDPAKVFSALTDKHQPGEEVYAAAALLDLLGRMPQDTYASFVELAIINMAKFDNQIHLFHYSNFPTAQLVNTSTGKPVNFKLQVGSNCGARLSSPLRSAIARFFAVSPKLVLEHIFSGDRLIKRTYSSLLCELLKRKVEGEALREELLTNAKVLKEMTAATFDVTYEPPADGSSESQSRNQEQALRRAQARVVELRFQGVRLVRSIIKWAPEILRQSPELMTKVLAVMKAPDREVKMAAEEKLPLRHRTLSRIACKSVIAGFKAGAPVAPLCEILPVALVRSTTDTLFLTDFFSKSLRSLRGQTRNEVISTFAKLLVDPQTSIALKEAILRLVLVPLLSTSFIQRAVFAQLQKNNASPEAFASFGLNQKDSSVMIFPGEAIRSLIGMVLTDRIVDRQLAPEYYGPASIGEDFEVQVLQLSTLLIAHSGKDLMEHRKSLIRLAWNHLSGEDTPAKHWAYINICTFIDVYHTPPDIILQVYVELLRAHTTEARDLVTRALDLLAPALHKRMEVSKYIKAIKWTKKLLFDDGHHLPQLTHVFQMVTHHPYMFYQYRAQFVPHMIMALSKVALPPNTPIENRELAVNVVELVLGWERTRELEEAKNAHDSSANGASPKEETTRAYRLVHSLFSIIANFLLKVTLQLVEARDARSKLLCRRCILLVRSCLNIAKRRSDKPLQLVYGIFAKPIHTQAKKQEQQCEQDLAQVKKVLSETGAGGSSEHRSLPGSPWDRRLEPGLMSCILELLTHIVSVDGDIVAKPFLEKHALDLHTMIDPMLGCFEKDANQQLAKFIFKLVQTIPLASEKPSFLHEVQDPSVKREQSNEERSGLFAGAVSHAPPPPSAGKAFYPAFQAALHRRLVQAAEDPKKLEATYVASLGTSGGMGGNSARTTSTTRHPNQYTMPTPDRGIPKIIQQRIAREVTSRQLEYQSAGPRGVLNVLKLLQVLCGSNDPAPYPFDTEIQPTQVVSAGVADRFSSILMKLIVKTTKDLFATTSAVSGSRAAAGQPAVAGANRIDMGDDIPALQRNKGLIAQTIDISLSLLSTATLNQEMRKSFMQILASLLDKLDISEQLVLRRVVKVVGQWFFAKLLGPRERSAFWTKLSNLEQRAAGLPETTRLVEDIHELALSFPPAHPRAPLIVGILSPSPKQRAKFWSMNFSGSVGNAPEFLGDLFAGRREDLLSMGSRFWLPLALRFLLESRLMTVHDTDLFHLLSRVAFADGSGVVASKAWNEVLASAWSVATDMERKSLSDAVAGLAIAAPMSTMSYMAVRTGFEQRRTAYLMAAPPAGTIRLANVMRKLDRSFLLSKLGVVRDLVESVWLVGGTSYMEPQTIRFLGNLAAGDKFATSVALEERLNLQETKSVETLLVQNSEMGDDDLVRGLLLSACLGEVLEKGITLELGNHWQKAMDVYLEYLSKQSLVGERDRIKSMMNKLNNASSMRALKRLKQDWEDDGSTDEETDLNDDGEKELELILNERSNAIESLTGGQARLLARGLDLRMRKCAASLGQWKTLLHWGEHERDPRLVVESLGRRPDLLTKPVLEEVRRCLPVLPSPAASLDHACLEVCMAMHNGLKPGPEMEDLLKKAYRTALLLHPCPSKGVSQRLVELEESVQYSYRLQKALPEVRPSLLNNLLTAWTQRPPTGTLSPEEYAAIASWRLEYVRLSGAFGASTELDNNCALVLLQGARHARLKGLLELAGMYIEQALTLFPTNKSLIAFELVNERSRVALTPSNVPYETLSRVYEDLEGIRKVCERKDVLSEANRMRGKVFAQAGKDASLVDEAFAQAVTSEANSSRAWLDWARAIASRSKPDAAACAARALALGLSSARLLVPLLLEPEGGAIGLVESISPSIFISWISTLLAHPCPFSKAVLERLVVSEPQAMLHELTCIRPQQLGGTPRQCIESIRKNHAEVFQEFTKMKELLTGSAGQISDWRPRSLRIPGTRRKLDRIVIAKEPCGRRGAKRRADMFSDDGRAPVRFAIHETTLDEPKKRMITLIYVAYDLLIQDGGLSEYFVSPAIFHVDDAAFLEKDAEVTSVSYIVQSELKWFENGAPPSISKEVASKALRQWFFRQFTDYDSLLNGRRRFAKQFAAHSLVTSLCPGVLVGSPNEILVGRGFESTFIVAGVDTRPEDAPSSAVPFRLSPNLQTLLTMQGVYGPFASGLAGVARCLAKGDARHTLGLLMGESELERHEILSDKDDVKDGKVLSMIREALGFVSDADVNANAKWMPWC